MAVVVDLDAARRRGEVEQVGELGEQFALRRRLGELPVERLLGVALGLVDQPLARSALGVAQRDAPARAFGQGIGHQLVLGERPVEQDFARRRHLVVELREEGAEHLVLGHVIRCARGRRRGGPSSARRG